jgi:hypothetical protein
LFIALPNCGAKGSEWFNCPTQIDVSRLFEALHLSGTNIAFSLKRYFQVSTPSRTVDSKRVGRLQRGEERSTRANFRIIFMKTQIKIKKRDDRKVTQDGNAASPMTNQQRTTEAIVKTWIRESRERRRAALNRRHNFVDGELKA